MCPYVTVLAIRMSARYKPPSHGFRTTRRYSRAALAQSGVSAVTLAVFIRGLIRETPRREELMARAFRFLDELGNDRDGEARTSSVGAQ